jgi:hypothetical protein
MPNQTASGTRQREILGRWKERRSAPRGLSYSNRAETLASRTRNVQVCDGSVILRLAFF